MTTPDKQTCDRTHATPGPSAEEARAAVEVLDRAERPDASVGELYARDTLPTKAMMAGTEEVTPVTSFEPHEAEQGNPNDADRKVDVPETRLQRAARRVAAAVFGPK